MPIDGPSQPATRPIIDGSNATKALMLGSKLVTTTKVYSNDYLRVNQPRDENNNRVDGAQIVTKPHGLLQKTIRLFGGPTKDDMVNNEKIRTQFRNEFESKYPGNGEKILRAVGFLKERDGKFELAKPTEPLSMAQVRRMVSYGERYEGAGLDFHKDRKDFLKINP